MPYQDEDEDRDDVPGHGLGPAEVGLADPAALAVTSLVAGTLSLGGFGLMNGANFVVPVTQDLSSAWRMVLAGVLGAALAGVAVVLGVVAGRRTRRGDPAWVARVAAAAVLVSGTALVLRLVATAASAAQLADSGYFAPL